MPTTPPKGTKDSTPKEFAQTTPESANKYADYAVMQQLMEISGDLKILVTKHDRLNADVAELKTEVKSGLDGVSTNIRGLGTKVGRAEIGLIVAVVLLVAFGGLLWWLFGAPITYLRDQMIPQQPVISIPLVAKPSTPPSP